MTHDHQTDTDDLVERLEDSKGWPNLGKAAAARIRADAELIKAAEAVLEQSDYLDEICIPALVDLRQAQQIRAALKEKNDD